MLLAIETLHLCNVPLLYEVWITRANSCLKCILQSNGWIWRPLKIRSSRCIQMHQFIMIMISMKKGTLNCCFNEIKVDQGLSWVTIMPIDAQHFWANEQVMKRCARSSSTIKEQQTQLYDGSDMLRRFN